MNIRFTAFISCLLCWVTIFVSQSSAQQTKEIEIPTFRAQTIDSKVVIGYGVAIGDVDGDEKPDILLADKKQFAWYQNPTWKRHVIAENLTERDNVCIAARDIDGDGKVEIAVGGQWNPVDTVNSGSIHYLVAPEDRTQKWKAIKLHNEPVVHRMRWVKMADKKFALVVAPLHGRANKGGMGKGAKLMAYYKPENPNNTWQTEVLDDTMHVTHNFDVRRTGSSNESESIFYLGKEGAKSIAYKGKSWQVSALDGIKGGGEIRMGKFGEDVTMAPAIGSDGQRNPNAGKTHVHRGYYISTIEPFHGTELCVYKASYPADTLKRAFKGMQPNMTYQRSVLDKNFNQGHAIAVGKLIGDGSQQIVAGWRKPNDDRKFGVKLYYQYDATGDLSNPSPWSSRPWKSVFIDENDMACEDLRIADLNDDGRPDIVASGRSTHNLKIYWNEPANQETRNKP